MSTDTMTTIMNQLAISNNYASDCFNAGNFEGAIRHFTDALTLSKQIHQGQDSSSSSSDSSMSHCDSKYYSLDQLIDLESSAMATSGANNYKFAKEDNLFIEENATFIFQRPIRIHQSRVATIELDKAEGLSMISVIIIFNLALSFQLSAIQGKFIGNFTSEQALNKAIRLYECAFQLLQNSEEGNEEMTSVDFLLFLAILNNSAHAYAILGDKKLTDDCSRQLLSALMFLADTRRIESMPAGASFDCFFLTTYHFIFAERSQSAPAA